MSVGRIVPDSKGEFTTEVRINECLPSKRVLLTNVQVLEEIILLRLKQAVHSGHGEKIVVDSWEMEQQLQGVRCA